MANTVRELSRLVELFADFDLQAETERKAVVNPVDEVINDWGAAVRMLAQPWLRDALPEAALLAFERFDRQLTEHLAKLPKAATSFHKYQSMQAWQRIRDDARAALSELNEAGM